MAKKRFFVHALAAAVSFGAACANAEFVNLDFEAADVSSGVLLPGWTLGWSSTGRTDSNRIEFGPAGAENVLYDNNFGIGQHVCVGSTCAHVFEVEGGATVAPGYFGIGASPVGSYALLLQSGTPSSPTYTFAAQSGRVPGNATNLELFVDSRRALFPSDGPAGFAIFADGEALQLQADSADGTTALRVSANISDLRGEEVEFRFAALGDRDLESNVLIDDIVLTPVPLPAAGSLLLVALALLGRVGTRRLSASRDSRAIPSSSATAR